MASSLPLLLAVLNGPLADPAIYDGRQNQLDVQIPRLELPLSVDGVLDEAAWREAAILTGFSQFSPSDGRPADDSTQVLVWYSPTAIHFGIRAFEAHGAVRATLADRDRIAADDNIQILLGTFNDGRQAFVFGVNPLGIQSDGTLNEGLQSRASSFISQAAARDQADLSADFVYLSRGRLTSYGYEVEVRIPFKSLKYQSEREQIWGLNVVRQVKHSGYEDSWTPAVRANASFLAQSGRLRGLTDLRRGVVLDLTPEVTEKVSGAQQTPAGGWEYDRERPTLGGNVRWGVTNNLTLNGTVNPDFSQVESDAGQATFDPRFALFFQERRPFFLDGIEQFQTPNRLIYTRRVVQPEMALKLTGKLAGTNVAFLSAVDDRVASPTGEKRPIFNIARVTRDLGSTSRLGFAYTDRAVGGDYNRVANVDGRFVFGKIYSTSVQTAGSITKRGDETTRAPLWEGRFNREGRTFGVSYVITGIDPDFVAASGFIARTGTTHANLDHRVTLYGKEGALLENWSGDVALDGTWQYDDFVRGQSSQDRKLHVNNFFQLRGGWSLGASVLIETFGYDEGLYLDYALEQPTAGRLDTIPFTGGGERIPNLDWVLSARTPRFKHFSGTFLTVWGHDENFFEWASASILYLETALNWVPTEKLRVDGSYIHNQYDRRSDGTTVGVTKIPRLKVEYQLSRPIFLRVVGQYVADRRDALRDEGRTNYPVLIFDPDVGDYVRAGRRSSNGFRADWLFSYRPNPGTVVFLGYGSSLIEDRELRFRGLRRTSDGFFVKLSYLFRV
jgi:hypothetical protein